MGTPCYIWDEGYPINFFIEPDEPSNTFVISRIYQLLEVFSPFVQPLAILASLGSIFTASPYLTANTDLIRNLWYVVESSKPEDVRLTKPSLVDVEEEVPTITQMFLKNWLQRITDEPVANSNSFTTITRCEIDAQRTILFSNEYIDGNQWLLTWNPTRLPSLRLPIEQRGNESWVSAPVDTLPIPPAITLVTLFQHGILEARIAVHWSWWFERGHPEFDAVQTALRQLVAYGWTYQPQEFEKNPDLYELI